MIVALDGLTVRRLLAVFALGAAVAGFAPSAAAAECQVLAAPSLFDPPGGNNPPTLQGRQDRVIVGGPASARRLMIRYNYGYLLYDLASPAAPRVLQQKDMRVEERYPVGGDGQTRAGAVSLSSDATRALVPWGAAGFGAIALSGSPLSGGGEYAPPGSQTNNTAIGKTGTGSGTRYLGLSVSYSPSSGTALYVADLTNLQRGVLANVDEVNQIYSEPVSGPDFGGRISYLKVVEAAGRAYAVAASGTRVTVIDISSPGSPGPGLTNNFSYRSFTVSDLRLSGTLRAVSAALHPEDGGIYILAETATIAAGYPSLGVSLSKVAPPSQAGGSFGSLSAAGDYVPVAGARRSQPASLLIPFDTDVVAVFFEGSDADLALNLNVRSSNDFSKNLAAGLRYTSPTGFDALDGFRSTGGTFHLYMGQYIVGAYATSLNCVLAPTPAQAMLTVEKVPASGAAVTIPDDGSAFVGDQIRIRPSFTPPDSIENLTDWRFDYDYHEGATADYRSATPFVANPDVSFGVGGSFPSELTVWGPCDPDQVPVPDPSTGAGCWTSVISNDANTASGAPDFATAIDTGDPLPGATAKLTTAFEVRNGLNGATSSLVKHRINWKVPRALLKNTSILSGGSVEDGSEGTPTRASTGYIWYFSSAKTGDAGDNILTRKADCTGPVCNPGLTQRGDYRYWVSVPYKNGFRTPDCPGLNGEICTGEAAKVVSVTDVVLSLTVPTGGNIGAPSLTIGSTSKKGTAVAPCGGATGFSYNLCTPSGANCPVVGSWASAGMSVASAFPTSGAGSLTIPMPAEGTYGVRLRYQYTTTGDCGAPLTATWPEAEADWDPLTVIKSIPTVRLFNSSGTTEIEAWQGTYGLTTGQSARAYAYVNGIRETALPAGASFSHRNTATGAVVQIGSTQGASFSISTRGDYVITLTGYGVNATADIAVEAAIEPPPPSLSVSSFTASPTNPAVGQNVTFTCRATGGSSPYDFSITFGDGTQDQNTTGTFSHAYTTTGTKQARCTATDTGSGNASRTVNVTVGSTSTGTCDFTIKDPVSGAKISWDPVGKAYDAYSGQPVKFEATSVTPPVSWTFRPGATATGNPVDYTYTITGEEMQLFTAQMTAGSCSKSYQIYISPSTGQVFLDFGVADAATGVALAKTGTTFEAKAAQELKFTASAATGAVAWDFGDGTSSTEATPVKVYTPAVDTTYAVKLTNGANTKQYSVLVKGSTGAPLTGNYIYRYADGSTVNRSAVEPNKPIRFTAADQATTFTWDFGDGSALATGSPKDYSFTRAGAFAVKLTVARSGVPGTTTTPAPTSFTVKPPPDPLLWVAGGMAYTDNGAGVKWQSDLSIHNPGTGTATLSLGYVSGAGWDGVKNVVWVPQALVAGETKSFTNVLKSFFRLDQGAWGVVLVRGDDITVPPIIVSRTYNAALADTAGTFGLSVPALFVGAGVKPQSAEGENVLAGLRHDASFRTNLTVANLKDETSEVEVVFRDANGTVLGVPARVTVEPRGVKQLNAALSAAPALADGPSGGAGWSESVSNFSAEVTIKKGSGVYPYATVIDQVTGDSIVVTPAARPSPTYRLPGIVRVKGKNGPYWVSDISVLNPTSKNRRVTITYSYVKTGVEGRASKSMTLAFKPWEMQSAVDFVRVWLGLEADDPGGYASSFVDVTPAADDTAPGENLVVVGKTYTPSGDGSVGLQVDPFAYSDGISGETSSKRIVLSGLEANQAYRTNLALFLTPGSTGNAQVDVKVLDSFGRQTKAFWGVGFNGDSPIVQLNSTDLFPGLTTDDVSRATIVIDNPRGTAVVGAYATVIDNKSEDATFVAGQPAP